MLNVNKVTYGERTLIDLTSDTATAETVLAGYTAHGADGAPFVGTYQPSGTGEEWIGDGNTHIWIHLEEGRTSPMLGCCPNGTVTVDWGDGTEPDTLTGTGVTTVVFTPTHNYEQPGNYVITLTVDGYVGFSGTSNAPYLLRHSTNDDKRNYVYLNAVKKIELGNGTTINEQAFMYCNSLESVIISDSVKSISRKAFNCCYSLKNIVISDSVMYIGVDAFNSCYSLESIVIPDGVKSIASNAFTYCDSLESVIIPNSTTLIEAGVFLWCNALVNVVVPGSVTTIKPNTFNGCTGVRFYDFTTHTSIPILTDSNAFSGIADDCEIRVPATLCDEWKAATNWSTYADYIVGIGYSEGLAYTLSEDGTYYSVSGIGTCTDTDIIIPPEYEGIPVKAIGFAAFAGASITSVHIPDSVTSIGASAFDICHGLTGVKMGGGVTSIGDWVFYDCIGLTSITIPGSVTSIGNGAFYDCTGVRFYDFTSHTSIPTLRDTSAFMRIADDCEIRVPATLYDEWILATNWAAYADYIVGIGFSSGLAFTLSADKTYYTVAGIGTCADTDILIPPKHEGLPVKSIAENAFKGNTSITSVIIPNSVKTIGQRAFGGCTSLTRVKISDSVTTLQRSTFSGCTGLTDVNIPANATAIGRYAFYGCTSMVNITIPDSVTSFGAGAFAGCAKLDITVSAGNQNFVVQDNIIYTKSMTHIATASAKIPSELTIPDGIISIGGAAFEACKSLTSVIIPPVSPPSALLLSMTATIFPAMRTIWEPRRNGTKRSASLLPMNALTLSIS